MRMTFLKTFVIYGLISVIVLFSTIALRNAYIFGLYAAATMIVVMRYLLFTDGEEDEYYRGAYF